VAWFGKDLLAAAGNARLAETMGSSNVYEFVATRMGPATPLGWKISVRSHRRPCPPICSPGGLRRFSAFPEPAFHRDVAAYLLALKSLYSEVGHGQVLVIDDGSLIADDLAVLRHHVPGIAVLDIGSIDTGRCLRGGTWERLVKIIELSAENYVIQFDADTLVSGAIPEVVDCWRHNRSFLLGTDVGQQIGTATDAGCLAQGWLKKFAATGISLGVQAEAVLDSLPDAQARKYVHASSGFAGFAKGAFRLSDLEAFLLWMRGRLQQRWDEWGSEQISSNYILANAPNAEVLPFDRYACFEPHISPSERPFLHFIGTYRFNDGVYRKRARHFLGEYALKSRPA
jgi:hypothetical protein